MNSEFQRFVKMCGDRNQDAADVLGVQEAMIRHICIGRRGVSKKVAKKVLDLYPELSLYRLLYGDPDE